jgi:hypothetical protein
MSQQPSADDRFAISNLCARYAWALDTGDTDGVVDCFTPDAFLSDAIDARGHDQIRRLVVQRYHGNPVFPGRQHQINQVLIAPHESGAADRWRQKAFAQVFVMRDIGPSLWWVGHYDDIVVLHEGRWLFEQRIANRWMGEVLAGFPSASITQHIIDRPPGFFDPL